MQRILKVLDFLKGYIRVQRSLTPVMWMIEIIPEFPDIFLVKGKLNTKIELESTEWGGNAVTILP